MLLAHLWIRLVVDSDRPVGSAPMISPRSSYFPSLASSYSASAACFAVMYATILSEPIRRDGQSKDCAQPLL